MSFKSEQFKEMFQEQIKIFTDATDLIDKNVIGFHDKHCNVTTTNYDACLKEFLIIFHIIFSTELSVVEKRKLNEELRKERKPDLN